jgi:hypothetical protein
MKSFEISNVSNEYYSISDGLGEFNIASYKFVLDSVQSHFIFSVLFLRTKYWLEIFDNSNQESVDLSSVLIEKVKIVSMSQHLPHRRHWNGLVRLYIEHHAMKYKIVNGKKPSTIQINIDPA